LVEFFCSWKYVARRKWWPTWEGRIFGRDIMKRQNPRWGFVMFNDVRWATNLLRFCAQILCMTLFYKILNVTFFLGFNLLHVCLLWFAL
jgi:hypothetical protein